MPHQCTNCGHTFPDGSKEMLSGCPECGGTKFQFHPEGVPDEPTDAAPPEQEGGVVGKAAETVRDFVGSDADAPPAESPGAAPAESTERSEPAGTSDGRGDAVDSTDDSPSDPPEDSAQADARSEVVDKDSLPDPDEANVIEPEDEDRPDIDELREELNSQFESIRIVDKGQYELNLMELYDREEYIIALQENGRYVIEVPDAWHDG
ncbi:MAG: Zn-ribbon containing protein [Halobacteriaceae archaeon]